MADPMSWNSDDERESCETDVPEEPSLEIDAESSTQIPSFDFSESAKRKTPLFHDSISTKTFLIKKKGDKRETTMRFSKELCETIFEKIGKKFGIKEKQVILNYPIRTADGELRNISVTHDDCIEESLETFYSQAEEMSLLIVEQSNYLKRKKRPQENLFEELMSKTFTIDKRFYELMQQNKSVAEKFLHKRDYFCLLMGADCVNFLNPGYFICHVTGCEKVVKLKSFSNLSSIISHWKIHSISEDSDETCQVILRRHNYLTGDKVKNWVKVHDLPNEVSYLESTNCSGRSLAISDKMKGKKLFTCDTSFKGRHLVADVGLLKKIVLGDSDVLSSSNLTDTRGSIQSYFSSTQRKKGTSASSSAL